MTAMVVWPSLATLHLGPVPIGRWLGRLFSLNLGIHIGWLFALASIPLVVPLYFLMRLPRFPFIIAGIKNPFCWHYRLTNRRLVEEHPFGGGERKSISLDRFDTIHTEVPRGYEWYIAGDLVFYHGQVETFRITGVPRPETFRQTLIKAHLSYVGVQKARAAGAAV